MKPYRIVIRLLCVVLTCTPLLMLAAAIVQAQEDGLNETFDDPSLSGWEHNEGASAAGSILRLEPGGFAFHPGSAADTTLKVRARRSPGEGALLIYYRASDAGAYSIRVEDGYLYVQLDIGSQPTDITLTRIGRAHV